MLGDTVKDIGTISSLAMTVVGAIWFSASKLKRMTARDSADVASSHASIEIIQTLKNERDAERARADSLAEQRDQALQGQSRLEIRIVSLEEKLDQVTKELKEREEHNEVLIALLDHLIFGTEISPNLQTKLMLLRTITKKPSSGSES